MVPVCWALDSADVNAGTASAARIAIIAITTSNSISVNAEEGLFIFSFILGFYFCVVLRVFWLRGFCLGDPPSRKASADKFSAVLFWLFVGLFGIRLRTRLRRTSVLGFWSELKCGLSQC